MDASGQTASTGALAGLVLDPSGAAIPTVEIQLINSKTGDDNSVTSDRSGNFSFPLLLPGTYDLEASKAGFETLRVPNVNVSVTETSRLNLQLRLAAIRGQAQVSAESLMVQTDTIALGRVANQATVTNLPLVTRNYAQIAALSPGVVTGVSNAGELGPGGAGLPQIDKSNNGLFVHGGRSYDNNFELNGISVSDVQSSASGSGGSRFLIRTPFRNSRSRRGSTTLRMDDMQERISVCSQNRAAIPITAASSSSFVIML
jgi:hypothetical protein